VSRFILHVGTSSWAGRADAVCIFFVGFMFTRASATFLRWVDTRISAGVRRIRSRLTR